MRYQVEATNAKGNFARVYFNSAKEADLLHKMLWNELDENGMLKWSTVRTTDLFRAPEAA